MKKEANFDLEPFQNIETTDQLILKIVQPDDELVIIGPNKGMEEDPTLLMVSYAMAKTRSNNKLWVVDPIFKEFMHKAVRRPSGSIVLGWGNLSTYLSQLEALQQVGLPLITPEWTGATDDMHQISLKPPEAGTRRVIIDHNTSTFITNLLAQVKRDEAMPFFVESMREYHKTLVSKGLLVLMVKKSDLDFLPNNPQLSLISKLKEVGFMKIKHFSLVKDKVSIPIDSTIKKHFKDVDESEHHPLRDLAYTVALPGLEDESILTLNPEYPSLEVFIAET